MQLHCYHITSIMKYVPARFNKRQTTTGARQDETALAIYKRKCSTSASMEAIMSVGLLFDLL